MALRWIAGCGALAVVAGCSPGAPAGEANRQQAEPAAAPSPAAPANATTAALPPADAASAPLATWLVGTWSYGESCASDLYLRFATDGTLENAGDVGTWTMAGDQVTQTVRERFAIGDAAPTKLDPPEVRRFTVTRIDWGRGVITIEGRRVPVQRC